MIIKRLRSRLPVFICTVALAFVGPSPELVWADGSEGGLGAPGITIAAGSGIVVAGTGADTQPAIININVPGTSVAQALLYWSGEGVSPGDDTIDVDFGAGSIPIVGVLIGGPTHFFNTGGGAVFLTTYRADVSSSISTGANTLSITGIKAFQTMSNLATKMGVEGQRITIHTPLIDLTKAQIIKRGIDLGVDYSLTFSCYDPRSNDEPCGHCDSCLLRTEGFRQAGITDPDVSRDR